MTAQPLPGQGNTYVTIPPPQEEKNSLLSNILAIAGFIIIVVIIIWGLVHLANLTRGWFSGLFGTGQKIEVTAPANATSGEAFNVTWNYEPSDEGSYAILYQCTNARVQMRTPAGQDALTSIPCGAAYTLPTNENKVSLIPFNPATSTSAVPLTIIFLPKEDGKQAEGSATVAIAPVKTAPVATPSIPTNTTATKPGTTTTKPSTTTYRPATPADLSVRILSVYTDASGLTTATFEIANVGGSASGSYSFSAQLPTTYSANYPQPQSGSYYWNAPMQSYTYTSPLQSSLTAGSKIVNTLRWTQGTSGTFSVSLVASDVNPGNNYATQYVNASYNYNQYPYNNQYQNYNPGPYNQYYPYAY